MRLPTTFGRGVVLEADDDVPSAWSGAPEVVLDDDAVRQPAIVVETLHEAWAARRPIVVRLLVDPATFRDPVGEQVEPWTLSPSHEVWHDRLHFLVWANTYDGRGGDLVWWWAAKAQRLGATPAGDGPGDIVLPDGTPAWVDGGPRLPFPALVEGAAVVHAESVDLGRLTIVPPPIHPTAELAVDQLAAVAHAGGPARVIAPAGSGKTRVLTERLRHLVVDRGYEREGVLAVAYNVKARDEMVERTTAFHPRVQTLNGLGYEVLREGLGSAPPVLDERDVRRLVDDLLPRKRQRRVNTDPIAPYLEALGQVRLGLRNPAAVEAERDDVEGLAQLFGPYREALQRRGAVDFDEQVYLAVQLLLSDGGLRRRLQARSRHLLVDEFQDLTPAHVLLLRLLAAPRLDVFGVGDDDQVIYGHAGASPAFLIDFAQLFPGAHAHALEVNHRCPQAVVEAAANLLSWNRRRVDKAIRPGPSAPAGADRLRIIETPSSEMAVQLRETVEGWVASGADPADIAVLTRVNSLLLAPQVALVQAGLPVASQLPGDVLGRLGVRAALAYLRLAVADRLAADDLAEVYQRPSRGFPAWITKWFRDGMTVEALAAVAERIDDAKVAAKVTTFADDVALLRGLAKQGATTRRLLTAVRTQVGLGTAMEQLDRTKGEGSSQLDDLEALEQVADLHPDPTGFEPWLRTTLRRPSDDRGVTLATVHRVKGREWPDVVLFGVSSGLLPHRLAADEEEERRVLHVGITRARRRAVLLADADRPSPFLAQLATPAPDGWRDQAPARPAPKAATTAAPRPPFTPAPGSEVAFEALKAWRLGRARADKVAPFIIFSNIVLQDIAARRPTSTDELARIGGIGATKLDRYGDEVLAVLAQL
jgi:DNA helicase II / ATP-dependent DNA helicase PcrA